MTKISFETLRSLLTLGPLYFEEKNELTNVHNRWYGTTKLDNLPESLLKATLSSVIVNQNILFYDLHSRSFKVIPQHSLVAASLTKKDRSSILKYQTIMKKQKPTLNFLATLLNIGEVTFSYDTKKGKQKTVCGTLDTFSIPNAKFSDGGVDGNGNVTYWDVDVASWKTIHKGAQIEIDFDALDEKVFTNKEKYLTNNISANLFVSAPLTKMVTTAPVSKTITSPDLTTFNNNSVNIDILLNLLNQKIVKFEYTSSKGLRVAYGTTDSKRSSKVGKIDNKSRTGSILYYDIEKDGMRTVTFTNKDLFKVIEVLDLPLKK